MSTLSSSSSYADIVASYLENLSYEEDEDVSKCGAFITAAQALLRLPAKARVTGANQAGHELEFDNQTLQKELAYARAWRAANKPVDGTSTTYGDFTNFRS